MPNGAGAITGGFRGIGGGRTTGQLNIPFGEFMPPEMGQALFEQVELGRQRQEQEQMKQFIENINAMGRLHTGSALKGAMTQVLGPGMERRQKLLGDIALQGVGMGREERLGEVGFQRERQFAGERETFQERMTRFQSQQAMKRLMEQLASQERIGEMEEEGGGFLESFIPYLAAGVGTGLGGKILPALGQLF